MQWAEYQIGLRSVAFRDADTGRWVAHCLEMDVVAEGESPDHAIDAVRGLCVTVIEDCLEHDDFAGIFRAAPAEAWGRFARARDRRRVDDGLPPGIESWDVRVDLPRAA